MATSAINGIYHDGRIELLEDIPYKEDRRVIIVFLNEIDDKIWNKVVAEDFICSQISRCQNLYDLWRTPSKQLMELQLI